MIIVRGDVSLILVYLSRWDIHCIHMSTILLPKPGEDLCLFFRRRHREYRIDLICRHQKHSPSLRIFLYRLAGLNCSGACGHPARCRSGHLSKWLNQDKMARHTCHFYITAITSGSWDHCIGTWLVYLPHMSTRKEMKIWQSAAEASSQHAKLFFSYVSLL